MEQVEDRENENESVLSIPADIAHFYRLGVLDTLLLDHTTGNGIVWATDTYEHLGEGFGAKDTIAAIRIIGPQGTPILRRAQKERVEQASLTKAHAEVFTPAWVCAMMIDHADQAWMKDQRVGDLGDSWRAYVNSPCTHMVTRTTPMGEHRQGTDRRGNRRTGSGRHRHRGIPAGSMDHAATTRCRIAGFAAKRRQGGSC